MLSSVLRYIERHQLLGPQDRVLVAVSGGLDSVCLLDILYRLRPQLDLSLQIVHVNHQLRGTESDADAQFVRQLADQYALPVTLQTAGISARIASEKGSVQEIARQARYAIFEEVAQACQATKIATGHTADDQAETVLMRFLRGSGLRGLSGIAPRRDPYIRPLLNQSRASLVQYLQDRQLAYREDSSNAKTDYFRNHVRHTIFPFLHEQANPALKPHLAQLAELFRAENDLLSRLTAEAAQACIIPVTAHQIYIDLPTFVTYDIAIQRRLIYQAISQLADHLQALTFHHIEACLVLALANRSGQQLHLPAGIVALREASRLVLDTDFNETLPDTRTVQFTVPGSVRWGEVTLRAEVIPRAQFTDDFSRHDPNQAYFDWEAVRIRSAGDVLLVRSRRAGDRFQPLGLEQPKRLKKYLIDAKVPRLMRDAIPLIFAGDAMLWVAGHEIAEWAKIRPQTTSILKLEQHKR
ncbi:MAG: tRNA lysidine(34) synthetase TilS [Gemmatimonadetes bacterium]|nr:MAG: tRNA lysidine(34) synthetase TilS [Gemmatimonadota bacterium]